MFNKVQTAIAKMKIRALLSSKGDGILKGLKFREGSKSLTIGEVRLRTNLPLMELKLDSIESFECSHKEYEFNLVIKDLKICASGNEFVVEELTIESFLELKQFVLEIKGITEALSEEQMW